MAKLVRARPKRPEYLPEWAHCCEKRIAALQSEGEILVDLESVERETDHLTCAYCGAEVPDDLVICDTNGEWGHVAEYDLDEGEYVAGSGG